MSKKAATILLIIALAMVLFFTFQEPEKSRGLSETVSMWLGNIGIYVEYKALRRNIHILEYFVVGNAVCGFCRRRDWRLWIGLIAGCAIGALDESVKMLLPGREFEVLDLFNNWAGVLLVFFTIVLAIWLKKREV